MTAASFGFTFLSKKALGQAEQAMFGGVAGVRDEVGFLIVHQRYADRFFPGTSVLHTRLRYALLIPWIYQTLREQRPQPRDFAQAYVELEHRLTGRLKFDPEGGERDGVIGGEVYSPADFAENSRPNLRTPSSTALPVNPHRGTGGRRWNRWSAAKGDRMLRRAIATLRSSPAGSGTIGANPEPGDAQCVGSGWR